MVMDVEDNVFLLAGPVKMHRRVLEAMAHPAVGHRSKWFSNKMGELRELLKYFFNEPDYDVALLSASATAGMEALIANLVNKDDKVLVVSNGKFGERFEDIGNIYASTKHLKFEWGTTIDMEKVKEELEKEEYKAVTLVHNETSAGMTNPAEDIGKLAKKYGAYFIMDGVTSIGNIRADLKKWNVAGAVAGSQKCIAGPAGLAMIALSPEYMEELHEDKVYYLKLKAHVEKMKKDTTPYTPSISPFMGLLEALKLMKEEGLENRINRIQNIADGVRSAVKALNLELLPPEGFASNTVTAIKYPEGISDSDFRGTLRDKYNVIIAGGQAPYLKGKIFRIGHMGIVSWNDIVAGIASIEATLQRLGYRDFEPGDGVAEIVKRMS